MRTSRRLASGGLLAGAILVLGAVTPVAAEGTDHGTPDPPAEEAVSQPGPAPEPSPAPEPEPVPAPEPAPTPGDQGEEPGPGATDATADDAVEDDADAPGAASVRIEPYDLLPILVPDDEQVTWSYLVTNDGDVEVTDLVLTDSTGATVTCPLSALAPGVRMICSVATVFGS